MMETAFLKVTAGRTETIVHALLDGGAPLSLITRSSSFSYNKELLSLFTSRREGESVTIHYQLVNHKHPANPGRGSLIDLLGMPDMPDSYTQSMVSSCSDQKLEVRESFLIG